MADFQRPEDGFRFAFGGVNTKEVPDALPPMKYQAVQNVRATADLSMRTRPGTRLYFSANNNQNSNAFTPAPITDMRAYTTLNNFAYPRILARDNNGRIFLDNQLMVGDLNGSPGVGVSMNPFRPRESATPWMYVAGLGDYQRFSAPSAANAVVQNKVGIAEPQAQVLAQSQPPNWTYLGPGNTLLWPADGNNTSATIDIVRSAASVATTPLTDPVQTTRQSIIVNANNAYGIGETLFFSGNSNFSALIEDVIPGVANSQNLNINAIRYWNGNNGNVTIFLGQLPQSSDLGAVIQGVRRGMVARLNTANNGIEYCLIHDAVFGQNGIVSIDTSTTLNWDAITPKNISLLPTVVINSNSNAITGLNMNSTGMSADLAAGISTISHNEANTTQYARVNGVVPQENDYLHISVMFSDPTQLIQLLLLWYLDKPLNFGVPGNILYYAVRPSDLVQVASGNQQIVPAILDAAEAQLIGALPNPENITPPGQSASGNNQWAELWIPISSLQRIGSDLTKSLADAQGFQMQVNVAGNTTFGWSSYWNAAGKAPDVGNNGEGYKYLCVPMSSNTGVMGNPTPLMRYGVNPRRQAVVVQTANLNNNYDPQIDTWAVYRYGGSVTPQTQASGILSSYRFLGTTPVGNNFVDTFYDDAAAAGDPVAIDNTEPWPTIDAPWRLSGNSNAYGQWLVCTSNSFPASMNRWLPGTLFQVGLSNDVFTLRSRPVISGANNNVATFEFEECIGAGTQVNRVFVLEPNVAAQPLPYVWGPNEYGHFFGCGDPFRPSTVYWAKQHAPDACPTKNNLELCQPSEPLLGGHIIKGVSLAASSLRWWYLNFQSGSDRQQYVQVEAPVGKRLAAPYGMASDGSAVFFWADDCIAMTEGSQAVSLTDDDLYNLFPHGGLAGVNVTSNGVTYYAPDYSRAGQFRLTYRNGLLYAFYPDTTGTPRVMVLDVQRKAWSQDVYAAQMRTGYSVEQPKASLSGGNNNNLYPNLLLGDNNGSIWQMLDGINDGVSGVNVVGTPIAAVVATREFNAGDARTNTYFGDLFLDGTFPCGGNITPIVQGQPIVDANNNAIVQAIAANNNRQFIPVSLEGTQLVNFLGVRLNWTDNYYTGNAQIPIPAPTRINLWQPSYVDKPETITTRFGDTLDFGQAVYMRGCTIYADTFGQNKSLKVRNMDNNTLVPLQSVASNNNTASIINHNGEQEINYWFNPPFVTHMVRDEPQDALPWRKFKMNYIYDPWPELTDLPSPWMNVRDTGQAGFLQGLVIPLEVGDANNNTAPNLVLRTDNRFGNNNLITLIPYTRPEFNVKTGVAYSLETPVVCHQVQLIPQAKCRVWWNEVQWVVEATPDMATHWITQWMGFGIKGFKTIPRVEGAYASQSGFELHIDVQDGTAPDVIMFPGTGGATAKFFINLTFNKGQLFRFRAIGSGVFQLFMEDFMIWVGEWGRLGSQVPYKLGAEFGDKARI